MHSNHTFPLTSAIFNNAICLPREFTLNRVLLVEDDPATRWIIRRALKNECLLSTADCALQAIEKFVQWSPDLVFLDIGLPDRDGREVLDWMLRKDPNAQVVIISAHSDPDIVSRTFEQGAIGFIPKPFLTESITKFLRPEETH